MTTALRNKLYALGRIEQSEENDIRLDYILFGLFHFLRFDHSQDKYHIIAEVITADIHTAFPALTEEKET